ncbi:hypothetical protein CS0771_59850 [Catellatospora sp. IY07-71]|uniref:suppressor of fused domain protein n=1 Tax=Catellatospora sp. IY07-71 TaxID=2728827 RepID=UPI001BB43095|nr:suppressor of fused domain protein [Catellatospora sp. IY07-71]BCJ76441.1 hypothetical protein CS0771_59850 [Catellatospora sp. IY07-71]
MTSRVEAYLAHLDQLSGGQQPEFRPVSKERRQPPGVTVLRYRGLPAGMTTSLTYGLSLGEHPSWTAGRPELCLSVRSDDLRWSMAMGLVAERLHGDCGFRVGDVINFNSLVAPGSGMTAFLVAAPATVPPGQCRIDVGGPGHEGHDIVDLVGFYPIHDSERRYVREHGVREFWKLDWDAADVTRPPVV